MTHDRVVVYWRSFPGYAADCIEQARRFGGLKTLVLYDRTNPDVDYDLGCFDYSGDLLDITGYRPEAISNVVQRFCPTAGLVGGWRGNGLAVARGVKEKRGAVIGMVDHVGRGAFGRIALRVHHRVVLDHVYDGFWVPGKRTQRELLESGIPDHRVRTGMLAVDTSRYKACDESLHADSRRFLFVGRYLPLKGVRELLDAFLRVDPSWELRFCGRGRLAHLIHDYARRDKRIGDLGFVQPRELPRVLEKGAALVLPSRRDAWPVATLEASACALPVICTRACGVAEDLVEDTGSGFLIPRCDSDSIFEALARFVVLSKEQRIAMGRKAQKSSERFDAGRWARRFIHWIEELKR